MHAEKTCGPERFFPKEKPWRHRPWHTPKAFKKRQPCLTLSQKPGEWSPHGSWERTLSSMGMFGS